MLNFRFHFIPHQSFRSVILDLAHGILMKNVLTNYSLLATSNTRLKPKMLIFNLRFDLIWEYPNISFKMVIWTWMIEF